MKRSQGVNMKIVTYDFKLYGIDIENRIFERRIKNKLTQDIRGRGTK